LDKEDSAAGKNVAGEGMWGKTGIPLKGSNGTVGK